MNSIGDESSLQALAALSYACQPVNVMKLHTEGQCITCSADLLKVALRTASHAPVDNTANIGLVYSHAKRDSRNNDLCLPCMTLAARVSQCLVAWREDGKLPPIRPRQH
jgi:hypothetical protein